MDATEISSYLDSVPEDQAMGSEHIHYLLKKPIYENKTKSIKN